MQPGGHTRNYTLQRQRENQEEEQDREQDREEDREEDTEEDTEEQKSFTQTPRGDRGATIRSTDSHGSNRMMLQHPGPSLADISCSALVPCLSPPGTLTLDDFTNFTPIVKEELRLAIQTKRLSNGLSADISSDGASSSCSDRVSEHRTAGSAVRREITPQEYERRKRRRERNKIAAAKCRNKKKEKTETLQQESEKLETVNADLKAQIEELKQQKQQLVYMLNLHRPTCIVRAQNGQTPEDERNLFIQHIKESTLQLHNLTSSSSSSTSSTSTTSISTVAPLEGGLLTLDHIHCPGHL